MRAPSISLKRGRPVLLGTAATIVILLLAGCGGSAPTHAANLRWTRIACARVLAFKNALHRDGTSLNLGFGPQARVQDAIAEGRHLVGALEALGLPPLERVEGRPRLRLPSAAAAADLALATVETAPCRKLAADGLPMLG
jgi:hypothetical protein